MTKLRDKLLRFAISLTRDKDSAEDLVQNTLFKALKNKNNFQEGTNLEAWCFTILKNTFFVHRRSAWERRVSGGEEAESQINGETAQANQESLMNLKEALEVIKTLPPAQQEALYLVGILGESYEEAAVTAGTEVGTIKSRVSRARQALKEVLGADFAV